MFYNERWIETKAHETGYCKCITAKVKWMYRFHADRHLANHNQSMFQPLMPFLNCSLFGSDLFYYIYTMFNTNKLNLYVPGHPWLLLSSHYWSYGHFFARWPHFAGNPYAHHIYCTRNLMSHVLLNCFMIKLHMQ